tara:strand:- start:8721 stop:9383 length:663 start_codon:yes stop_codon:yes gene_type:complete
MPIDLTQFGQEFANPVLTLWNSLVSILPGIVFAVLTIVLGYIVGAFTGWVVKHILQRSKVDEWLVKMGRADSLGGLQVSNVSGQLIKWWVIVAFLSPAANWLELGQLSAILERVALWAPNLIAGVVIMLVGLIVADFFADATAHAKKLKGIRAISSFIRIVTIIFFAEIALRQIGINIVLAETTILIIIGGIVLALAIGFGLGLRKEAEGIIRDLRKHLK